MAHLPKDVIQCLGQCILNGNDLGDYVRFRAVCTSWRSATPSISELPPQPPSLLIRQIDGGDGGDRVVFFSFVDGRTHSFRLPPQAQGFTVLLAFDGWLAVCRHPDYDMALGRRPTYDLALTNPLTRAFVPLPPVLRIFTPATGVRVLSIAMSATPRNGTCDCSILLCIALHRPLLIGISLLNFRHRSIDHIHYYDDIVYINGIFYAINMLRQVSLFNSQFVRLAIVGEPNQNPLGNRGLRRWRFVESDGELLVLRNVVGINGIVNHDRNREMLSTEDIEVLSLRMVDNILILVDANRGMEKALFVGYYGRSYSRPLNVCNGARSSSVFLAEEFFDNVIAESCIFNLLDNSTEPIPCADEFRGLGNRRSLSMWHVPSPL